MKYIAFSIVVALCWPQSSFAATKPLPAAKPEDLGISSERLALIDDAVNAALQRGDMPGAVVLIVHKGKVIFRKAYGRRSVQPSESAMIPEIIFDLASLTKPIATATSIMILLEQGKLRLTDLVSQHVLGTPWKGAKITIHHLLTHTGGLIADNPIADFKDGKEKALERIYNLTPLAEPGARFIYSDVGYIVLGDIVERLSGMPLDEFAAKHIFKLLGMNETGFRPQGDLKARCAPCEMRDGRWMQGEVHDPRSYLMGGVAGHAGLFASADDLAVYANMFLGGKGVLSRNTIQTMTAPREVPKGLRTYGWDMATSYSANRGELFPRGKSFGHTGFTGTSIWMDPESQTTLIFLSNRVHPNGKGNVTKVRGQVATLTAAACGVSASAKPQAVSTGIDILVQEQFARLKGKRIGLITNHTGRDRDGRATIDLLHQAPDVKLVALFSPEHGIRGLLDESVGDSKDAKTGLPIYSLYGKRRKPTSETLAGIDTLVFDIQDIGCRFYTYISTLGLCLESAAEHKLKIFVLDRPNPIGGLAVEGPVREPGKDTFVAFHAIPIRHGMTIGEMALLFNSERKTGADLEVVRMDGWRRSYFLDRTGQTWVNPSPNMRSLTQALLYPGIGLLETTNISVGRGTDRPFEWIGAPWLDGRKLAAALAEENLPGVRFLPLNLTPASSTHKGKECGGVQIIVDSWNDFEPVRTGLAIASTIRRLYPNDWKTDRYNVLLCHMPTLNAIRSGTDWRTLQDTWQSDLRQFLAVRKRHLLYD